ncbi:MAG: phage tail protein [Rhodospirillaceae bacterium]|jgi:hypothetical protein|nr:phage tail protein [Rhodospirillaceae bacterium]MBT5373878.1 phage tail protein [Rhodospirillaceae bacterium]MBT5659322.1 phage tail protein [Rhodospirillaceae bacterium]MBT5752164.1 phage tail protein [Rhodospirillaceae bacterium]
MEELTATGIIRQFKAAKSKRGAWESHWRECYEYALPQREGFSGAQTPGAKRTDTIFDGTAADAVDQLAASLLAQLTPPWSRWFGLTAGIEVGEEERAIVTPVLDRTAATLQSHFDRSNFTVELHQCYLDLVTGGTASLLFEETAPGESSAFRFTAVPLTQAVMAEGPEGRLDITYRQSTLTLGRLKARFPAAQLPEAMVREGSEDPAKRFEIIEAVMPKNGGFSYMAVFDTGQTETGTNDEAGMLAEGFFETSPFINFRWLKAPGEEYGRSPVMKALPDIKTANKVVELVLKNATIAVTGIWQADDDGVMNPANIRLVPGSIIPKAVGSAGLTPLETPGRFDVSQLVLEDLRTRIRHAMLTDRLGQIEGPKMTATEVIERSTEIARVLGATYGRLQSELLTPLIRRGLTILRRRGEIPDVIIDGRNVDLQYRSPLAQNQARRDVQNTLLWLESASGMGPEAQAAIDLAQAVRWMGRAFGVPGELIREESGDKNALDMIAELASGAGALLAGAEEKDLGGLIPQDTELD